MAGYQSPVPKLPKVKASVLVPPDTLAVIDMACHVTGRSRNAWLWGLVLRHLPELAAEADAIRSHLRGRGINSPLVPDGRTVKKEPSCPTKSPPPPRRPSR